MSQMTHKSLSSYRTQVIQNRINLFNDQAALVLTYVSTGKFTKVNQNNYQHISPLSPCTPDKNTTYSASFNKAKTNN